MSDPIKDAADEVAQFPPFSDDPVDRLRHTLAAFADTPDDRQLVTATANVPGMPEWTGLTWGDLRALLAKLDES